MVVTLYLFTLERHDNSVKSDSRQILAVVGTLLAFLIPHVHAMSVLLSRGALPRHTQNRSLSLNTVRKGARNPPSRSSRRGPDSA